MLSSQLDSGDVAQLNKHLRSSYHRLSNALGTGGIQRGIRHITFPSETYSFIVERRII